MYYPNIRQEKKLFKKGFKYIAGVDEAGRGSWAVPIVAGAVILNPEIKIRGIKDSKLLRKPVREELFKKITKTAIAWAIGEVSHKDIDKIGLQQANILAMKRALKKLSPQPDHVLVDAFDISHENIPSLAIKKGDYKITSIAAASIIAKVSRDKMMDKLGDKYPQYGFNQHKGYGTNQHFQMLTTYGVCEVHRKSFEPIRCFLTK